MRPIKKEIPASKRMELIIFLAVAIAGAWAAWILISNVEKAKTNNQIPVTTRVKKQHSPRRSNSSDDDYQKWLTKAVEHKKSKDFDQAIECLDKAYRICAGYELDTVFEHYLRLPMYLQAAGRGDEGWGKLNKLNIGVCPYRGDGPTGSERDIRKAHSVSECMRKFLDKEKRYKDSIVHRVVASYLWGAIVAQMVADGWMSKESEKDNFSIEMLTIEFNKAAKKAKLEEPLGAKLAEYITASVKEGSNGLYALSRVPEVMATARTLIEEN